MVLRAIGTSGVASFVQARALTYYSKISWRSEKKQHNEGGDARESDQ